MAGSVQGLAHLLVVAIDEYESHVPAMKDSTTKYLADLQYEQRKTAGLLRTSDGRLGENCTHVCKPPKRAKATWRCPKCLRRPIPERGSRGARVNPYRDGRGRKTELARQLRTEHDEEVTPKKLVLLAGLGRMSKSSLEAAAGLSGTVTALARMVEGQKRAGA